MTATTNTAIVAAATTITTGLIVFIIGQAVLKFVYDPYLEQQRIMLDIIHSVLSYADAHAQRHDGSDVNDKMKERILEATYKFKSLAAELVAANTFVKGYGVWRYFFFAPTKEDILWIAAKLAALSNIWLCPGPVWSSHNRNIRYTAAMIPDQHRATYPPCLVLLHRCLWGEKTPTTKRNCFGRA